VARAMPDVFYAEIENLLKLIAREWDGRLPASDTWEKELLLQMAVGGEPWTDG
jgi:hypothetical protein